MEKTLELKRMPDDEVYKLDHEYFTDADGRIWQNAGRVGDRPMRLYHCEPSGEPSSPIYGDIVRVTVDGVDADFLRFNRETWEWEKRSATALNDEQLRRQNEERKRKYEAALKRTAARINYLLERAKKRLAWRVGDLSVIIPHTQEEFTAEGHAMRNCIGGYYRRQADGSTFCFFIRKNGEPHADVEMSLNGRIKQCYTAGNKNVPLSTRRYANRMARYFAKQMKRAA